MELIKFVRILNIPHFRGVFMRNDLPNKIKKNECGFVNLDDKNSEGSHWTAYVKQGTNVIYFDPFGNLKPPTDLTTYFNSCNVQYNYDNLQTYKSYNCGQLCIRFLYNIYY